jgi:hypothetical protein
MTSQTKHYIEVSDILSVRCDCKHCGASLSLPLSRDVGKSLLVCPQCNKGWARLDNSTEETLISEFALKVEKLVSSLPRLGFNLLLEIASDPASTAKG